MNHNGNGVRNLEPIPDKPESFNAGVTAVALARRLTPTAQLLLTQADLVEVATPAGPRKRWQFKPEPDDLVSAEEFLELITAAVREELQPLREEIRVLRNKLGKGGDRTDNLAVAYDALPPGMAIVSTERLEALEAYERSKAT